MKILFVQVSDIHWRATSAPGEDRAKLIGSTIGNATSSPPDEVVAIYSGDLVWSGLSEDYTFVETYLCLIEESIRLTYPSATIHRIVCPGNHDCDFGARPGVRDALIAKFMQDSQFKGDVFDEIIGVQDNFFKFAGAFVPKFSERLQLWPGFDTRIGWKRSLEIGQLTLNIVGLNTAWLSVKKEKSGKIIFPPVDFAKATTPGDIAVAVMHHPFSWLDAPSAHDLRSKLLKDSDMIFSGHEHLPVGLTLRDDLASNEVKIFESAAFFDNSEEGVDGFSIVLLDTDLRKIESFQMRWENAGYQSFRGDIPVNPAVDTPVFINLELSPDSVDSISYTQEFSSWIDNSELPLFRGARDDIKLREVYVFPELKKIKVEGSPTSNTPLKEETDLILNGYTVIMGPTNSGKTSLSKALCRVALPLKSYPLHIDARKLRNYLSNTAKYLEMNIDEQYGTSANLFRAANNANKIIIIDDFHAFTSKSKKEAVLGFLSSLKPKFGRLLILGHDLEFSPIDLAVLFRETAWGIPVAYQIQPFSFKKRNQLISRWLDIGPDEEEEKRAQKVVDINKTLDVIIGRNFVQPFPAYILAVLQGIEAGREVDLSTSTHGHLYEIFIKTCLAKRTTATNYNIFSNFLGMLAYRAFKEDRTDITDEFFRVVHKSFEDEYDLERPIASLKTDLLELGLITKRDGCYYFSEKFVLYYFVAYYIKDRLHESDVRTYVEEMAAKLWVEDYANVMMFIVHLTKDVFVVDEITRTLSGMFALSPESDLKGDLIFLKDFADETVQISAPAKFDKDEQVTELEKVQSESVLPQFISSPPRQASAVDVDDVAKFNAAVKGMQLLGQVLKNFPASFRANQKVNMAEQCLKLGLRCLGFYFAMIRENQGEVIRDISEIIIPTLKNKSEKAKKEQAKAFVVWMCRHMAFGIIKRISYAIGSRELYKTYERIFSAQKYNDAYLLVQMSLALDRQGEFPESRIKDHFGEWKRSNYFASTQLKMLVSRHFKLFEVPYKIKQSTAEAIDIKLVDDDISGSSGKLVSRD